MIKLITENPQESRKEWLLWMFRRAGRTKSNITTYQVWQHHNHPIEIYSEKFFDEKLHYIHQNPVTSGFVCELFEWKYSSARNYAVGLPVLLDIDVCS